jgi:hypothetical protein
VSLERLSHGNNKVICRPSGGNLPVPIQGLRVEPLFVARVPYCPLPYNAADLDGQASCPQRRRLIQGFEPASIQSGSREPRPMRPTGLKLALANRAEAILMTLNEKPKVLTLEEFSERFIDHMVRHPIAKYVLRAAHIRGHADGVVHAYWIGAHMQMTSPEGCADTDMRS